jgi:hypothetical protein
VIAAIRPDSWNIALLLHVGGAMVMVGALVLAVAALVGAWRSGSPDTVRLGYRALLYGALPAWVVMRAAAQWILSKEGLENASLSWTDIGFFTSEGGLLFIIIATVLAGLALRRVGRGDGLGAGVRVATVITGLLVAVYVVSIWAMTTKPV